MDLQEQEYCVMECGEEELDERQKTFYSSKQKDLNELIELASSSRTGHESFWIPAPTVSKAPSSSWSLTNGYIAQSAVTSAPSNRPLVVLNPSVLNQLASTNGYMVCSTSSGGVPPVSTVGVPSSSSVRLDSQQKTPASTASVGPITLSSILNANHQTSVAPTASQGSITLSSILNSNEQTSVSPLRGPLQHPIPRRPPPPYSQHIPAAPSPSAPVPKARLTVNRGLNSAALHIPSAPLPRARAMAPVNQGLTSAVSARSSINNGPSPIRGPHVRFPIPPKDVGNPNNHVRFPIPPKDVGNPNNHVRFPIPPKDVGNTNSHAGDLTAQKSNIIQEMSKNFTDPEYMPIENGDTNKRTAPPSNLPLLPETRLEAASDSRPRPRPGPASRTRPVAPDKPSSSDSGSTSLMVDLTQEDLQEPKTKKAPVKEKTFPSLIVTARASLRIFSNALVNNERLLMDNQIRKVMQMMPSVFVEYLLQQRLLKSEQFCELHNKPLKLGIYSDPNRFSMSGGYVWIADCCKSGLCSVYSGSLFDKTLQPPTNIIKLMYHWACNTAAHNVQNWVKVDSYVMKTYYTFFRAICTTMVQQKLPLIGGPLKKIQVGVISIGTYPEGGTKEVKVDIMAVLDPDVPQIRLKVLENFLSDNNNVYETKFRKILEVLTEWVHPQSTIITDFAVDMHLCHEYGFSHLEVSGGRHTVNNNNGVMDYMRAKIPVMFQNTLGMLSFTIIQQFLDELVWRETWGPFPSRAYETLVRHVAELTKLPGPDLITKLKKIASEPTKNWKFSVWSEEGDSERAATGHEGVRPQPQLLPTSVSNGFIKERDHPKAIVNNGSADRPLNAISPAAEVPLGPGNRPISDRKIFLEAFYYGFIEGNPALQKRTGAFLAECPLCKRDFLSASSFTNHLVCHALNATSEMSKVSTDQLLTACPICCKVVKNLESHKEAHMSTSEFICKICRLDLKTEEKIIKHMCYVHQELEMPYKCDICLSQTSIYDNAVNHFKDFHDKDSYVRCPFCLKTVRFTSKSGLDIPSNVCYFVQHVQKHSLPKLNRKCEKCALSFSNMGTLKQHQEKVHMRSGRLLKKVRRVNGEKSKMLVMPFPMQAPLPPVTLNENSFHTLKGKALSSSVKVPEYYSVCSCLECDAPMTQNHFSVKMSCTKCSYQSCCPNAIREHSARRHFVVDSSTDFLRSQILGGIASLDRTLYCSYCTYSSNNGNKIAAHMASCGDGAGVATPDKRKLGAFNSSIQMKYEDL